MPTLSVVVPVKDEAENVAALAREIAAATAGEESEIIFVDDGSADGTLDRLRQLKTEMPNLRVMHHNGNYGQSRAVRTGVRAARADIVVTLDGDGQNDPIDIPKLLSMLRADNSGRLGLVGGVRVNRQDASNRRFASNFANGFRRRMLKDQALDSGCGLRAFRHDAYMALPYFDHMHRFMIALMLREGYEVREIPVNHRHRIHGTSKYGNFQRAMVGLIDTVGVRWLQKRSRGQPQSEEM